MTQSKTGWDFFSKGLDVFSFTMSLLALFHLHLSTVKNKGQIGRTQTCACILKHMCTHAQGACQLMPVLPISWDQGYPNSVFLTTPSLARFFFPSAEAKEPNGIV